MKEHSTYESDRIPSILCFHSETNTNLSCPDDSFIDMLPAGESDMPSAVFVISHECPSNTTEAETEAAHYGVECKANVTELLSR